ncbi:MAG: hypothetical protein H7Z75_01025 [Ferruginibacter sp.]|nr:hypothetical protein [Cytophagales bacterium]
MADEAQSLGRKLYRFFVREKAEPVASPATMPAGSAVPSTAGVPPEALVPNAAGTGVVDKKFVDHFAGLLEKANLPGPDYFEYLQALKNMEGLGLEEEKRFLAAFATFKAMGGSPDPSLLVNAANQYLTLLNEDKTGFLADVNQAIDGKVNTLKSQLQREQEAIREATETILACNARIATSNENIAKINGQIVEQSAKINHNKTNYEITHASFVDQIGNDIKKIKHYLGGQKP